MVVDGEFAKMWIADGILFFVYKPVCIIDIKRAKVLVHQRLELQNEIEYPIFCDLREVHSAQKEARDYLASEGSLMTKALAFLVKDEHSLLILKMYMHTTTVKIPTQIFMNKTEALEFLKKFK